MFLGWADRFADLFSFCRSSYEVCKETADWIRARIAQHPKMAIICGSGLGDLADVLEEKAVFPYEDIPHFPRSTGWHNPGHQQPIQQQKERRRQLKPAPSPSLGSWLWAQRVPRWGNVRSQSFSNIHQPLSRPCTTPSCDSCKLMAVLSPRRVQVD